MSHLVILGLPGTGKTTIGRIVAEATGRPFLDSDAMIHSELGVTGREVAARDGVDALHALERDMLRRALATEQPSVLAVAASVADDPASMDLIEGSGARVALLVAEPAVLAARQGALHRRPLTEANLEALATRRESRYRHAADIVIDTGTTTPDEAVGKILEIV